MKIMFDNGCKCSSFISLHFLPQRFPFRNINLLVAPQHPATNHSSPHTFAPALPFLLQMLFSQRLTATPLYSPALVSHRSSRKLSQTHYTIFPTSIRYTHLNAEFQKTARRDKKAFLSDQCKEIEENKRMGKTRDLFEKIRDTKGTFHSMMGSIKDRNSMDLTETEDIKKRWQEYTEELYKIDIHDPDNHDGVITHLEPGILECKVKWALGSITMNKASGGDGTPVELFQILKDDAVKVLHSIC